MTMFSRPSLEDFQFKQPLNSTLTLSGQTKIATISGLTLSDGAGGNVLITASGATNGNVMTYHNGIIGLFPASSGVTGVYDGLSPTTCAVGGLPSNSVIYGCTVIKILEKILVPTLCPTFTNPSRTFTISPSTSIYEIGCSIAITANSVFDRGLISPAYGTSGYRSGLPSAHHYTNFAGVSSSISTTNLSQSYTMPAYTVAAGIRTASGCVSYSIGEQPKDSTGGNYDSPYAAGTTAPLTASVCGVLPWYYGKKTSNTITCADVAGGTKGAISTLASSTLPITFNSASNEYLWFAVPAGTPAKTSWYVCASNQGSIGGSNNLFASACSVVVSSAQGCWSSCAYNVYVSCVTTGTASGVPMCMI